MNKILSLIIILIAFQLVSCSGSQQSNDSEEQVYVFDEVPVEKTIDAPKTGEYPTTGSSYYVVQIGAFTTEDKAEDFAELSREKTNYRYSIVYSGNLKLYLVQVIPFFKSRTEAEEVRNNLWKTEDFVDAWILTVYK
jgi:cell division septation protein DedD